VIAGKSGTLIVDAGNSPAHARLLLRGLAELDLPKPKYLALTHGHWDHVFGASIYHVPVIANRETQLIIDKMAKYDWSDEALDRRVDEGLEIEFCRDMIKAEMPCRDDLVIKPPDMIFNSPTNIDLGETSCQFIPIGGDHSSDSSIVYIPDDKVIFLGDCIYPNIHSIAPSYTTNKLLPLLSQLLGFDADYYLAAHDPEPMTRRQMEEFTTIARLAGRMVEDEGLDRESILKFLQAKIGTDLNSDTYELVDGFIAGLNKPGDQVDQTIFPHVTLTGLHR